MVKVVEYNYMNRDLSYLKVWVISTPLFIRIYLFINLKCHRILHSHTYTCDAIDISTVSFRSPYSLLWGCRHALITQTLLYNPDFTL